MSRVTSILVTFSLVAMGASALSFEPLFDARIDYGAGDGPVSVFSADLDGDGDYDLAVANAFSDNVSVLMNLSGPYPFVCADANGDSLVNMDDVDFLIDFYFYGGTTPFPYIGSDLNCDGSVNIADITYLASYINGTGAAPCCQ